MLAGGAALGLPVALFLPRALGAVPGQEGHGAGAGAPPLKGWIALLGTLCFAAPLAAVAVYVVPLARQAGLSVGAGRTAISVGLACQILGGVLATVLAGRVRYIAVFWACAVALFSTWAVYALGAPAGLFIAVTGLAGVCGGLGGPFLVPMTIEADPSRRAAVQSGAVQLLAGALGPLLAALVVSERDAHGVLMLAAALLVAGLAIIMGLHRANRRAAAR